MLPPFPPSAILTSRHSPLLSLPPSVIPALRRSRLPPFPPSVIPVKTGIHYALPHDKFPAARLDGFPLSRERRVSGRYDGRQTIKKATVLEQGLFIVPSFPPPVTRAFRHSPASAIPASHHSRLPSFPISVVPALRRSRPPPFPPCVIPVKTGIHYALPHDKFPAARLYGFPLPDRGRGQAWRERREPCEPTQKTKRP